MKIAMSFVSCLALALLAAASSPAQTDTGSGKPNTIPIWTGDAELGNSIISQSGNVVTVKGAVQATTGSGVGVTGDSASSFGVVGTSGKGVGVAGSSPSSYGVEGQSTTSVGVAGFSKSDYGVQGTSDSNVGVEGLSTSGAGVHGSSNSSVGVAGQSTSDFGVEGDSTSSTGVAGFSTSGTGVEGTSNSSYGVEGVSTSSVGVKGNSTSSYGVEGISTTEAGVAGFSTSDVGVAGVSKSDYGLEGTSDSNVGVMGTSTTYRGVQGNSTVKSAVAGISTGGDGVSGATCSSCTGPAAIAGVGKLAGAFSGDVGVDGDLSVTGLKAFHIDHPLDPANKYLNHFSTESNEALDTYSGNVTTDRDGTATVELPDYFEALNTNYRYQLTVIGQFAQAIVSEEIKDNRFIIRTDKPEVKVSWQVTGVRSDAYVKAHPMPVEEEKAEQERGYYLTPEVFGQPEERSIAWLYHGDLMRDARAIEQKRRGQAAAKALQEKSEQQAAAKPQSKTESPTMR